MADLALEGPGLKPIKMNGRVVWAVAAADGSFCVGASFEKSIAWSDLLRLSIT